MLFDWFTIAAQIVNFVILVWLLKRFLYGPILRAVESREAAVAARVRDAEAARLAAEEKAAEMDRERRAFEDERQEMMRQAREDIEAWRSRAEKRIRGEVEEKRQRWLEALAMEQAEVERVVSERVAEEVLSVSRRVLSDLGDASLEERLAAAFLREVTKNHAAEVTGPVRVGTGASVSPEAEQVVAKGLRDVFSGITEVHFERAPELGFGMRLEAGDKRIGWTLSGYLDGLQERVMENLSAPAPQEGGKA